MQTAAAAAAKSLQSCLTLCDPIDGSPPGSAIPGILQARTLEWVAISFSNAWKWKVKVKLLSHVRLFATPWTTAYQAPPSMGFSRQEYWSGVPLPSPSALKEPWDMFLIFNFDNLEGKVLRSQFLQKHDSFKRGKILDWLSALVSWASIFFSSLPLFYWLVRKIITK